MKSFAALVLLSTFLSIPTAKAAENRVIDIVTVSWPNASSLSATNNDVKNAIETQVTQNWKTLTSFEGQTTDNSIDFQVGTILANPIVISQPMACEGQSSLLFMSSIRAIAYQRMGISNFADRYLVILAASNNCIWSGKALIGKPGALGGTVVLHDNADAFVITHELGHALGLGHSNLLRCSSGAKDGPWGSDCKAVEYGGTVDVMGNVPRQSPLSTYHQWRMGLLESAQVYQSWLSEKIELSAVDTSGKTKAIFIRDGSSTYWIEYRKASSSYSAGLAIYRTDPPPTSAIISPNAEALSESYSNAVGTDLWLLNWDNYQYSSRAPTGSMTLPSGKIATFFSSNVSLTAEVSSANADSVTVSINRKADQIAPAAPQITAPTTWRSASDSIIQSPYQDLQSIISDFELLQNGQIQPINASSNPAWSPTYLEPLSAPKTVLLSDLPEGNYEFQIRAKDIWGNTSAWSNKAAVNIDRGAPVATTEFSIGSITENVIELDWKGAKDEGSGICELVTHNEDGWVTYRDLTPKSPTLVIQRNQGAVANTQLKDCQGNILSMKVLSSGEFISAESRTARTGKWQSAAGAYPKGSLTCVSSCSLSFSAKGNQKLLFGKGNLEIFASGKKVAAVSNPNAGTIMVSNPINLGSSNKVLRVKGKGFTVIGISNLEISLLDKSISVATTTNQDLSLNDATQFNLSRFGFSQSDFISPFKVAPMNAGTTLQDATLDFCKSSYLSDAQRVSRRQVTVTAEKSNYLFLSSEVVRYRSQQAAKDAEVELLATIQSCQSLGGFYDNQSLIAYKFHQVNKEVWEQSPAAMSRPIMVSIGQGVQARTLLAWYHFNKDLLSGLYVVKNGDTPYSQSEVKRWQKVSEELFTRLTS
jgi:hypothetical protein